MGYDSEGKCQFFARILAIILLPIMMQKKSVSSLQNISHILLSIKTGSMLLVSVMLILLLLLLLRTFFKVYLR